MEQWPDGVIALGLPMEQLMLCEQDRLAIGARTAAFRDIFQIDEIPPLTDDLYVMVNKKIAIFPSGGHARLGGCSFKKPGQFQKSPVFNSRDVAPHILQDNPRVAGLLASSLKHTFDVCLFIRPWQEIPQWAEFRLFMRERVFVGVSQYFHTKVFPIMN